MQPINELNSLFSNVDASNIVYNRIYLITEKIIYN